MQQLAESAELINLLFDSQPDNVTWFLPVMDKSGLVIDFKVGYCNSAACHTLKSSRENIMSQNLLTTGLMDEEWKKNVFEQCKKVFTTNQNLEFTYHSTGLDKYFHVQRNKVQGGVLNITRDCTQLETIRKEKDKQAGLLDQIISNSPYGVSLYESIRNGKNAITDFKLLVCNQRSADFTGFSIEELYKYTVKELMMIRGHSDFFEMCSNVVETGKPVYTEFYSKPRNQWLAFSIIKFNDGYLLNYIDINETKLLEKKATTQAAMLDGIMNATISGLLAMEPIMGFSGKILDFKFTMFNRAAEKILGIKEGDKEKSFLGLFPSAKSNGLFDFHCKVFNTGEPVTHTVHYTGEGLDQKCLISISKMGDNGVVQNFIELN
ncbi:MAG: PAS domain-containing protein [Bacteroidetes bacterium]|nr:PAS domain-containing protein [Bacteroidota bacterium]